MKKFSSLKAVAFVMAFLLIAGTAFGHTGASAADQLNVKYDAASDTVILTPDEGTDYKYIAGNKQSMKTKAGFKDAKGGEKTEIVLSKKVTEGGAGSKVPKAAYVYVGTSAVSDAAVNANISIAANTAKIKTVTVKYWLAATTPAAVQKEETTPEEEENTTTPSVTPAEEEVTPTPEENNGSGTGENNGEPAPEASGIPDPGADAEAEENPSPAPAEDSQEATPTDAPAEEAKSIAILTVSDGTKDIEDVEWCATENGAYQDVSTFTAQVLYEYITKSKAEAIYVRVKGTDGTGDCADAKRPSKAKKVKIAVQKTGKTVKIDYIKGTIAVKNGFDFFVADKALTDDELKHAEENQWVLTVLPYNKQGAVSGSAVQEFDLLRDGTLSKAAKCESGKTDKYFTKDKVKSISISDYEGYGIWYVRTGATAKKPASTWVAANTTAIKEAEDGPDIDLAKVSVTSKGAILLGASGNLEFVIIPGADVKLGEKGEGSKNYYYEIATDLAPLKWTKIKSDKGIKVKATTKVKGNKEGFTDGNYILIRTQGVKNSTLPSNYTILQITKSGETIGFKDPLREKYEEAEKQKKAEQEAAEQEAAEQEAAEQGE